MFFDFVAKEYQIQYLIFWPTSQNCIFWHYIYFFLNNLLNHNKIVYFIHFIWNVAYIKKQLEVMDTHKFDIVMSQSTCTMNFK